MAEYKNLMVNMRGKVMIITISRERALNALNRETINELQQLFSYHWSDDAIGAVIITGAGEKAFVAGADIPELADLDVRSGTDLSARGQYLMKSIQNFPKPVIAAINGFALGGGLELAMACDIRLASEKAKLGQPEVNLGLIPGYGGTQRLARLVGRGKAMQMIFTGESINAAEAYRIGLVEELCAPEHTDGASYRDGGADLHQGPARCYLRERVHQPRTRCQPDCRLRSGESEFRRDVRHRRQKRRCRSIPGEAETGVLRPLSKRFVLRESGFDYAQPDSATSVLLESQGSGRRGRLPRKS